MKACFTAHPGHTVLLLGIQQGERLLHVLEANGRQAATRAATLGRQVFSALRTAAVFPCRYFGAKDWSVPGALGRLCVAVFHRCAHGTPIKKSDIIPPNSGYHRWVGEELLPEEIPQYYKHLFAYETVDYHRVDHWLAPIGFENAVPDGLMDALQGIKGARFVERDGFIFDLETKLKVGIFRKGDEVVVAFGSLGAVHVEDEKRGKDVFTRSVGCLLGGVGFVPPIYANADKLIGALLQTADFQGENPPSVELSGLSLGGSLASYVGLRHGIKAVCMNAYTLGAGLQHKIGKRGRARADELITHIIVKGDTYLADQHPVMKYVDSFIGRLGIKMPGNLGKKRYLRNAYHGPTAAHRYPYESAMEFLGLDGQKKPYQQAQYLPV